MTLIREIPKTEITESQIHYLTAVGFFVRDCGASIEIWAEEMAAL